MPQIRSFNSETFYPPEVNFYNPASDLAECILGMSIKVIFFKNLKKLPARGSDLSKSDRIISFKAGNRLHLLPLDFNPLCVIIVVFNEDKHTHIFLRRNAQVNG